MKALLLAGGYGSRLRPLTNTIPKCLVPINGIPLLHYWLKDLVNLGCEKIYINTHYRANQVERFIAESSFRDYVELIFEPELLGTLGTVRSNKHIFDEELFIIAHADNVIRVDWEAFLMAHTHQRPEYCNMTVMLFRTTTPQSCGIVEVNSDGVITSYVEKPKDEMYGNLANGAVFVVDRSCVDAMCSMPKEKSDLCGEFIPTQMGKVFTFLNDDLLIDIGTPQSLKRANQLLQNKPVVSN